MENPKTQIGHCGFQNVPTHGALGQRRLILHMGLISNQNPTTKTGFQDVSARGAFGQQRLVLRIGLLGVETLYPRSYGTYRLVKLQGLGTQIMHLMRNAHTAA